MRGPQHFPAKKVSICFSVMFSTRALAPTTRQRAFISWASVLPRMPSPRLYSMYSLTALISFIAGLPDRSLRLRGGWPDRLLHRYAWPQSSHGQDGHLFLLMKAPGSASELHRHAEDNAAPDAERRY